MTMNRRAFLERLGAGALAAGGLAVAPQAFAWDPSWQRSGPRQKVLEINLSGGFSCFETVMGGAGHGGNASFADFDAGLNGQNAGAYAWAHTLTNGYRLTNAASLLVTGFAGWTRRLVVTGHDLLPHEAAVPLTHTGTTLGRPNHAGTAAVVNYAYGTGAPLGFVLHGGSIGDALIASRTTGVGGDNYPVLAEITSGGLTNDAYYNRTGLQNDGLLNALRTQYGARLAHGTYGQVGSEGHAAYEGAVHTAQQHATYYSHLSNPSGSNATAKRVNAARDLLATVADYVCVMEGGFDTHGWQIANGSSAEFHNRRLLEILTALNAIAPSLSNTVVVLTTEFGRKPEGGGTGHFPAYYAQFTLTPGSGGLQVVGATSAPLHPSQVRAAVLHAAGIDAVTALTSTPATGFGSLSTTAVQSLHTQLFS